MYHQRIENIENVNDKIRLVLFQTLEQQRMLSKKEKKELSDLQSNYMFLGQERSDIVYYLNNNGFIKAIDPEYVENSNGIIKGRPLPLRKLQVTNQGEEALIKLFPSELKVKKHTKCMEWLDRLVDFKVIVAVIGGFLLREILSITKVVLQWISQVLSL